MKDRNAEVDFHGQKRSNATHASTTDPDARLYRKGKGKEARLCHMGHALMENRSGLIVETATTLADGHAERRAALAMINRRCPGEEADHARRRQRLRRGRLCHGLARHQRDATRRRQAEGSALDGRTTRHAGYAVSQRIRKRIEEAFGWGKTVGTAAKTMLRGTARVGFQFTLNMAAYNLARLPKLLAT